ncbi:MAG: type II toxin-antitoxin system Phd/YefM family antitoxin [Candidatus Eremiobacteraeota bacterium]|nr:type II toxin-antitoxin system Phd/YefM family antitoxin [Candidatus Eremiobacteraeota bacterium]
MAKWQVQRAKAEFSALIHAAEGTPQIITRHGDPVAVVLSYTEYETLQERGRRPRLAEFLKSWPDFSIPPRDTADYGRDVEI